MLENLYILMHLSSSCYIILGRKAPIGIVIAKLDSVVGLNPMHSPKAGCEI